MGPGPAETRLGVRRRVVLIMFAAAVLTPATGEQGEIHLPFPFLESLAFSASFRELLPCVWSGMVYSTCGGKILLRSRLEPQYHIIHVHSYAIPILGVRHLAVCRLCSTCLASYPGLPLRLPTQEKFMGEEELHYFFPWGEEGWISLCISVYLYFVLLTIPSVGTPLQ